MPRTKDQIRKANAAHRKNYTTVGLDRETLQLIDKVKALQYQRMGIKLSRNQILTMVFKQYLNSQDILTIKATDLTIKETDVPPFREYQKAVKSGFQGTFKEFEEFITKYPTYFSPDGFLVPQKDDDLFRCARCDDVMTVGEECPSYEVESELESGVYVCEVCLEGAPEWLRQQHEN